MAPNGLTEDWKPSGGSLMYIRKSNRPKIGPRPGAWTPASTGDQLKHWPLSTNHSLKPAI